MPRIRTIKPEFWSSPNVEGMSPWARLLYVAMWNWADDYGRGRAVAKELAAFAFPHDDIGSKELPRLLKEVADGFGVVFYRVDGRPYFAIPTWDKHQRTERRAKPQHPAPEDGTPYDPCPDDQPKPEAPTLPVEISEPPQGTSDTPQGSSGPGTGEQGNRGNPTPYGVGADPAESAAPLPVLASEAEPAPAEPETTNQTAQRLTRVYYDRMNGMAKFPAVLSIVKRALKSGRYTPDDIGAGLERLAEDGRSVTVDALRYELDGFPVQNRTPRPTAPTNTYEDRISALQRLKSVPAGGVA